MFQKNPLTLSFRTHTSPSVNFTQVRASLIKDATVARATNGRRNNIHRTRPQSSVARALVLFVRIFRNPSEPFYRTARLILQGGETYPSPDRCLAKVVVPKTGLEPVSLSAADFKSDVYTIPPLGPTPATCRCPTKWQMGKSGTGFIQERLAQPIGRRSNEAGQNQRRPEPQSSP